MKRTREPMLCRSKHGAPKHLDGKQRIIRTTSRPTGRCVAALSSANEPNGEKSIVDVSRNCVDLRRPLDTLDNIAVTKGWGRRMRDDSRRDRGLEMNEWPPPPCSYIPTHTAIKAIVELHSMHESALSSPHVCCFKGGAQRSVWLLALGSHSGKLSRFWRWPLAVDMASRALRVPLQGVMGVASQEDDIR